MDKLHFINPQYFWGLLFLLIPIIVHLFNFRKAKTIFFTRVSLLKEIKTKKRNFSTLKKWLILLSRLLALLFFVLATSFPYLSESNLKDKSRKATFLYLDNSFSMQAKSNSKTLLEVSKKEIIQSFDDFSTVSQVYLVTNDNYYTVDSKKSLMLRLSMVDFSYDKFSTLKAKSRINNIAEEYSISEFNTIIYSDFNEVKTDEDSLFVDMNIARKRIEQVEDNNVSVDSVWLKNIDLADNKFSVVYKYINYGEGDVEFNESIKFNDKVQQSLTRKIKFSSDTILEIQFNIPESKRASGVISIKDASIWYDNDLFFSIDFTKKAKVLFVGDNSNRRLNNILNDEFVELENTSHTGLKRKELENYDFLIYSISNFSNSDIELLKEYLSKGKKLLLIPSVDLSTGKFNSFLKSLKIGRVLAFSSKEIAVVKINYDDYFFDDIFNSRVENFQYPMVKGSYNVRVPNSVNLLSNENGSAFLIKTDNVYLFSSPILDAPNPFVENDLALPILYKMSSSSLRRNLYESVGEYSNLEVEGVEKLSVLDVDGEKIDLAKMSFNIYELPVINKSGKVDLYSKDKIVSSVSFNYKRTESEQRKEFEDSSVYNQKYEELKNQSNVIFLWKWCITFAIAFLIIEMLLISFMKEIK